MWWKDFLSSSISASLSFFWFLCVCFSLSMSYVYASVFLLFLRLLSSLRPLYLSLFIFFLFDFFPFLLPLLNLINISPFFQVISGICNIRDLSPRVIPMNEIGLRCLCFLDRLAPDLHSATNITWKNLQFCPGRLVTPSSSPLKGRRNETMFPTRTNRRGSCGEIRGPSCLNNDRNRTIKMR